MFSRAFTSRIATPIRTCCRHYRLKPFPGPIAEARDARYIKILENKMNVAKARRAKEENASEYEAMLKQKLKKKEKKAKEYEFDSENADFFNNVLDDTQKALLKTFNIQSFQELVSASDEAETLMSQRPHPSIKQLKPRLRHAYNIYQAVMSSSSHENFVPSGPPPKR